MTPEAVCTSSTRRLMLPMALPTTSRAASDSRAASLVAVAALEALDATSWAVELISVTAVTT
ncbi:hypothetical protein D3C74_497570 [compost metagenome]